MQLLFDFLPLIAFFVAYSTKGIYAATAAIMIVMALQIAYQWIRHRKVNKMLLISGLVLLVFGGITLAFRNALFIQWKVTVVNWLFAVALLASRLFSEKTLIERALGHAIELERRAWGRLNTLWVATFFALGAANLYVMYNFDEGTWVNFKVFGTMGVMVAMLIGQVVWIAMRFPHAVADADASKSEAEKGSGVGAVAVLYAIFARDVPNSIALRPTVRPRHLAYLQPLLDQGRVVFAGPHPAIDSPEPGPAGFTGSLIIAEFDSIESAKQWCARDPYAVEGVFAEVTIKPVLQVAP